MYMYEGDTIRLKVNFKTFAGQRVNPVNVILTIYDKDQNEIEQIPLEDTNKENVGVYFYDYVPASELSEFIFEFAGTYLEKPILVRDKVKIKFI